VSFPQSLGKGRQVGSQRDAGDRLQVFAADLTEDQGWVEAIDGCDYVLHVGRTQMS
jgi:hypothetical protein